MKARASCEPPERAARKAAAEHAVQLLNAGAQAAAARLQQGMRRRRCRKPQRAGGESVGHHAVHVACLCAARPHSLPVVLAAVSRAFATEKQKEGVVLAR